MTDRRPTGALEREVLAQLWTMPEGGTPGAVLEAMQSDLAYTTVMTILTRLWEKGLVSRRRKGRAYVYRPKLTEAELAAERMRETLAGASDPKAALSRFVHGLSSREARALRSLLDEATARSRRR